MKVPPNDSPDPEASAAAGAKKPGSLTAGQRAEVTRRVLAGERAVRLAVEFGVTKAYVSLLKHQALEPERFRKKKEAKLSRKLTAAELEVFKKALDTGTPQSHGLDAPTERWTQKYAKELAWKLFGKELSVRVLEECLPTIKPVPQPWVYQRPKPPGPRDVSRLSPEAASDPEFVAWYLSPIAAQIEQRSYEAALRDYDERYDKDGNLKPVHQRKRGRPAGKTKEPNTTAPPDPPDLPPLTDQDLQAELRKIRELEGGWPDLEHWPLASDARQPPPPAVPAPGQRIGKHAKSKGSNYTPPRKKKKRR